jgi:integrase
VAHPVDALNGQALGSRYQLVFQTANTKPLHRRNVLRAVQNAADRAGLKGDGREPVGCHDLRHSCAAFGKRQGCG